MHVGLAMFCTDYAMPPKDLAMALEERGFESLWLPEHSHIPLSRQSAFPQGGDLPKKYYDVDVHAASALRGDVRATSQSAEHAYPA